MENVQIMWDFFALSRQILCHISFHVEYFVKSSNLNLEIFETPSTCLCSSWIELGAKLINPWCQCIPWALSCSEWIGVSFTIHLWNVGVWNFSGTFVNKFMSSIFSRFWWFCINYKVIWSHFFQKEESSQYAFKLKNGYTWIFTWQSWRCSKGHSIHSPDCMILIM